MDFEFNLYGLPVPSEVFFLNMPIENAVDLIKNRENKFTHQDKKDIHERDVNHLKDAYKSQDAISKNIIGNEIKCVKNNEIRTIEDIQQEIYNEVKNIYKDKDLII